MSPENDTSERHPTRRVLPLEEIRRLHGQLGRSVLAYYEVDDDEWRQLNPSYVRMAEPLVSTEPVPQDGVDLG